MLIDPVAVAVVCGLVLALIYAVLHVAGPVVPWTEFYARPFYYGIGFAAFLALVAVWGVVTGQGSAAIQVAIIGILGGAGMLTMYLWDNQRERRDDHAIAAADPRTRNRTDAPPDA